MNDEEVRKADFVVTKDYEAGVSHSSPFHSPFGIVEPMASIPADLPITIGQIIAGRYAVTGVLGKGGMGVVLAGRHIELGERVAIKFLNKEHSAHADRFFREARAAARIRSEHVVRIFDVGRLTSNEPYIVMEHLEGMDLADRLRRDGPMSPERVADILLDVCQALAEAHAAGIVHRDLKPANIFLARGADGDDLVKLLDFGIAKVPEAGAVTKTATVLGSPVYMSPEQLMASKDVDARSDIWSLGVIVYEMLTGVLPFTGDSLVHLALLVREKPTPSVRELRPDVPPELDAVVARCLGKERTDRFSDVAEFAEALVPFASPALVHSTSRIRRVLANARSMRDAALESTVEVPSSDPIGPSSSEGERASVESIEAVSTSTSTSQSTKLHLATAPPDESPSRANRVRIGIVVGMALFTLAIGWRIVASSVAGSKASVPATETVTASVTASPVQTSSAASATVTAPAVEPPPPSVIASASADAPVPMPRATLRPAVVTKVLKKESPHPQAPTTASAPAKPVANCNPPFTIDENGVRRAKPECL